MTDQTVSISVRIPASKKQALEEMARKQRMQTGESVAVSDIIRKALDSIGQPVTRQLTVDVVAETPTAVKPGKRAGKAVAGPDIPKHILDVINAMDVLARHASSQGLTANELANRFLEGIDPDHPVLANRLAATLPFMDAIGRIAAELDFEEK